METIIYFKCLKCKKFYSNLEFILNDFEINVNDKKNMLYFAHDIFNCNNKLCFLLEEKKYQDNNFYEICGYYNNKNIEIQLLLQDYIKIKSNILYMKDFTTGYLLDSILKTKIWFKKFERRDDLQQFVYKKRISINNQDCKINLDSFLDYINK